MESGGGRKPRDGTSSRGEGDARLVKRCLRGDSEAWDQLIDRYRRLIYSIALSAGLDADHADEAFQRVSLILLQHLGDLRSTDRLTSWIATATRRECWKVAADRRNMGRRPLPETAKSCEDPGELPDDQLDRLMCRHTLALALEQLAEPCGSLLHALFFEEPSPSYAELAQRLGRPVGSLGPTRRRCLERLERLYRQLGGTPP